MKLILVRHGETEENKKGILQGHFPGKLTKLGIEQSKKVALRLKDEKISAIFSSDLKRALDTAKEIARYHKVPLILAKELRERDQGSLSGKFIKDIDWNKPRDTEKTESMMKRAKIILDKAYEEYKDKTVVFISHGGLIKVLISLITNKPFEEVKKTKSFNTGVSIFEIKEDNKHKIILLECGKHLED